LPASVPEPIAVAPRRATSGIFICSPPEVSSMRLRMIEVMSFAHVRGEEVFANPLAVHTCLVNLMSLLLV
jgi:hypothetical protein